MADSVTPTPTPTPGPNMPVTMSAAKAPDGSWWISVTHHGHTMSLTYGIPLEQAERVADEYAANLKALVSEARRAASGLVIAGEVPTFNRGKEAARRNGRR